MAVRVFMYAQDNRGLGHVRRCAIVAEALLRRRPDAAVLLATKSPWAPTIAAGERFDVLKVPEHLARGTLSGGFTINAKLVPDSTTTVTSALDFGSGARAIKVKIRGTLP